MTTLRSLLVVAIAAALTACGGARTETTTATTDTTAGGETAETPEAHPIRTTTPIPVPQPAVAREQMSPELQQLWDRVEAAVATRPPEPPSDGSTESVNAWAEGPFAAWLTERARASTDVQNALEPLAEAPPHERGVAAGLFGYLQEDTVADVRGAPIPDAITSDAELLRVYDESMLAALVPYARVAVQAYRFCEAAFQESGEELWGEWAAYCRERASEVVQTYALEPTETPSEPGAIDDPEE
ncbi:hypothetical protein [Sandaracinus amylolyticus]|uniref:Uncharacterized protein n=1 Tax=Sandaracinus amylolyticus TaxID=927083 RepID=A0A0F6SH21_9BACT|nr:hypothetical protein [Sandaracinus amylolyticus]AKF09684.1 hypothetical protein DB32_006833 [Sandaracinus amylolyticus]